jgi:hypothetical protein
LQTLQTNLLMLLVGDKKEKREGEKRKEGIHFIIALNFEGYFRRSTVFPLVEQVSVFGLF